MMGFSLPLPEPKNEAERATTDAFLVGLAKDLGKALDSPQIVVGSSLDPVISAIERFFAGREQPLAVSALIRRYREFI